MKLFIKIICFPLFLVAIGLYMMVQTSDDIFRQIKIYWRDKWD
jgi:hypothetical protein